MAEVFETGIKVASSGSCTAKAQLYFPSSKEVVVQDGVARAILCHTLATPLVVCTM